MGTQLRCASCGRLLDLFPGAEPPAECPWCARSPSEPPPPAASRRRPWIGFVLVLLAVAAGVYGWKRLPSASRFDAAERENRQRQALYDQLLARARRIPAAELPRIDPEEVSRALAPGLGDWAETVRKSISASDSVEALFKRWHDAADDLFPDWALLWGFSDTPRVTHWNPRTVKADVFLSALALQRLRQLAGRAGSLDARLLERLLEYSLYSHAIFGENLRDPSAAFWLVTASYPIAERDPELLARRLEQVPEAIREVREHLRDPPRLWTEVALEDLNGVLALLKHWEDGARGKHPRLEAAATVAQKSLREYGEHLRSLLGKGGKCPVDPRWVRFLLKAYEFRDEDFAQLAGLLDEEARDATSRFFEAEARVGESPPHRKGTFDEALEEHRRALGRAREYAARTLGDPLAEDAGLRVMAMPPHLRNNYRNAAYFLRPFAQAPDASYLVTPDPDETVPQTLDLEWIQLVALHESYPGHHLHELHSRGGATVIQRIYGSSWLTEGWAMDAEREALKRGFVSSARAEQTLAQSEYNLAFGCLLELAVLCGAMTEEEGFEFLRAYGGYSEEDARLSIGRTTLSGLYNLGYVLGAREIKRLRENLKSRLGDRFDEKAFRERLLRFGRTPLALVRQEMLK